MKFIIVFVALFAVALAAPGGNPDADAQTTRLASDVGPDGYKTSYATSNGIEAEEEGQVKNAGTDDEAIAVRGSYQYIGDDGVTYTVTYVADENGFQPQGAHLPVAPEA